MLRADGAVKFLMDTYYIALYGDLTIYSLLAAFAAACSTFMLRT